MTVASPPPDRTADDRRTVLVALLAVLALAAVLVPLVVFLAVDRSTAGFADAEVLGTNRLGAATLDVAVRPGGGGRTDPAATGRPAPRAVFNAHNLAPGDAVSGQLEVANIGDLPLRYGLTAATDGGALGQWLRFDVWPAADGCTPEPPASPLASGVTLSRAPTVLIDLADPGSAAGSVTLEPGRRAVLCLGAHLPLSAPNTVQGQAVEVTLTVVTEQAVEAGR